MTQDKLTPDTRLREKKEMNYDEFVAKYGNRPKDIVYNMAVELERERIIKYLDIRWAFYEGNIRTGKSRVTFNLPEDWKRALKWGKVKE